MSQVFSEILDVSLRSIYVSGFATLLSASWSIPAAYLLSLRRRVGVLEALIESLVGMPTVLLGLLLFLLLSSSGPLGFLKLLYTPQAIIIGQAILITPLIISTCYRALRGFATSYLELALSLGAGRSQAVMLVLRESAPGVAASTIMGFSRAVGELGIAMMVGGNIRGFTRVMTTAIALDVARGEFESAIILGIILLVLMIMTAISVKILMGVRAQ
ncbi:MAG: ABC transporter permease [Nitrososphaerota archaeon]